MRQEPIGKPTPPPLRTGQYHRPAATGTPWAVSYTHLDVYKRQAPKPAPAPVKAAPVKAAPVQSAAASAWRAQLGAFGVEANARSLWATLEKKNPAFASRQPYLVKSGKLTRLQAGGFANKAEADAFCASVSKSGQACLAVDK